MPIIDAVLSPAEIALLPQRDLSRSTCVVFDVLRATSSIITGLAHGMAGAIPVESIEEALALKRTRPELILGGERHGDPIPGFAVGNSPAEYTALSGAWVATTTTNGTVALRACAGAARTLVGALLNMDALVRATSGCESILLVCAGTFDRPALEDLYGAGAFVAAHDDRDRTDAASACLSVFREFGDDAGAALARSENGRKLAGSGRAADVAWCARFSCFDVVGEMRAGGVVSV